MAHNPHVRTPGTWTGNLLPAELNALAANIAAGINGDEGGVWAPDDFIELNGSGLQVTGKATFSQLDNLVVAGGGAYTIGGKLLTHGTVALPSTGRIILQPGATADFELGAFITVSGLFTCSASSTLQFGLGLLGEQTTTWTGSPSLTVNATVTSTVRFLSNANLVTANSATFGTGSQANISAPVTMAGSVTQQGVRLMVGPNAVIQWRRGVATDAASTYDVSKDCYRVPAVASAWTYTIAHSGVGGTVVPAVGNIIHFVQVNGSVAPVLKRENGSTIFAPSSAPWWGDIYFDGSAWQFLDEGVGAAGFTNLA